MKIIHLTTFLDFGGIERKKQNISYWNDSNEWIFVCFSNPGTVFQKIKDNNKEAYCLNTYYKIPSFSALKSLYKFFKKSNPDVIHLSGSESIFHGFIAAKMTGIPMIVFEEIGISRPSIIGKFLFRIIYKYADHILVESDDVRLNVKKLYKIKEEKLKLLPNFIHSNKSIQQIGKRTNVTFKIVTVSRIEIIKNIEGVIEGVKLLKNTGIPVKLEIIGDGSRIKYLKEKVSSENLSNEISFTGFVEDPFPLLINSDLFVLNSFSEGFSNSMLEAMYLGIPVLSTTVGGANDLIKDGENGWLVPVNDSIALYEKLLEVINTPLEKRIQIGRNGQTLVLDNYSLQNHMIRLLDIYDS